MSTDDLCVYSEKFPPRKQLRTGLGAVDIQVVEAGGVQKFNPNSMAVAAQTGKLISMLGQPVGPSVLSGEPGYLYRNDVVEVVLTAEEIARLGAFSLEPSEFLALARECGVFYEISGKFYHEDTGIAINPNYSHAQRLAREAVKHLPHLVVVRANCPWQPHSIVALEAAEWVCHALACDGQDFRVVPLVRPEKAAALGLLSNIVAIHTLEDGALQAHGPFTNTPAAEKSQSSGLSQRVVASVPSFVS